MNEQARIVAHRVDTPVGFTARDFLRMMELGAFEDMRAELVGGVIEKMMPAFMSHGECNATLIGKLIEAYRGAAWRFATDLVIGVDDSTVRAVDIAVVVPDMPDREAAEGRQVILAVEIADTTLARDLGLKARDYARAGIATYWVVDLKARAIHVMRDPVEGDYATRKIVAFGQPLALPESDAAITID